MRPLCLCQDLSCLWLRISLGQFSFSSVNPVIPVKQVREKTLPAVSLNWWKAKAEQQLSLVCTQARTRCCPWGPDLYGELNENIASWFKYVLRAFSHTLDNLDPKCAFTASELKIGVLPSLCSNFTHQEAVASLAQSAHWGTGLCQMCWERNEPQSQMPAYAVYYWG